MFQRDSLAKKYYAPFNVNSKNYMDVPEETTEWCDRAAAYLTAAAQLTKRGHHAQAVRCFAILDELLKAVDSGKPIIFAEEAGSWMVLVDKRVWMKSYQTSLVASGEERASGRARK